MKQEADGNIEVSEGKLVWYNERKGYGFVRIADEEVFLHRSTLGRFGLVRLLCVQLGYGRCCACFRSQPALTYREWPTCDQAGHAAF